MTGVIDASLFVEFPHEHEVREEWSCFDMGHRHYSQWELSEHLDRLPLKYSIRSIREAAREHKL